MIAAIVACDEADVMGHQGGIPWHIPEDFKHFQRATLGHPVVMGHATWRSLPRRPLKGRRNIVLSRTVTEVDGAEVFGSLDAALTALAGQDVFLIGGRQVYQEALTRRLVDRLVLSRVKGTHPGDTLFPMAEAGYLSYRRLVAEYERFQVWDCTTGYEISPENETIHEMKNRLIDLDGTVCEDIPNEESHRFPDAQVLVDRNGVSAVDWVNRLYDAGDRITFFTARESKDREATLAWLHRHGFRFHGLLMDKPRGGNYVWHDNLDVRGVKYEGEYPSD
jgi:dihydrofolate reductase